MSLFACLYFDSDKSVSVLAKNKCRVRGTEGKFEVQSEVHVDWPDENGNKKRLLATILKIEGKGKQCYLRKISVLWTRFFSFFFCLSI